MARISRATLFMRTAWTYSLRSTCERGKVGCVIVQGKDLVIAGYNGAPPGADHCLDVGCDLSLGEEAGCQRTQHAEANAVSRAASRGIPLEGGVAFSTHSPCKKCGFLLLGAGVRTVVYDHKYRATPWLELADMGMSLMEIGAIIDE